MSSRQTKQLSKLYYSPKHATAFGGVHALAKAAKVSTGKAQNFLDKQEVYSLHKRHFINFPRRKVISHGIHHCVMADLADMQLLKKENDNYAYFLCAVDAYNRMFYAVPVKSKRSLDMLHAMEKLFESFSPKLLVTDRGVEFKNRECQKFLKDKNIHHFSTHSELKAMLAERAIRTIKGRLYKYFSHNSTNRWLEVLPEIVNGLNHSVNRSIKMRPVDVSDGDLDMGENTLPDDLKHKFSVGDTVRVSRVRDTFDKGYLQSFTREIFVVDKVMNVSSPVYYALKDLDGEVVEGSFYERELVKAPVDPQSFHRIEREIATRMRNGHKEVLVKWVGYPEKFNSWIPATDIVHIGP